MAKAELNNGQGLVGTGPFRFGEWQRGAQLVLLRNDAWWGGKLPWEKVIFRPLTNSAARIAALLAGDVDVVENPPTDDVVRLERDPNFPIRITVQFYKATSNGVASDDGPDASWTNAETTSRSSERG